MAEPRKISVHEITQHASPDDLWLVVNGAVYDLSEFAPRHPGGTEILHRYAGRDASRPYSGVHGPSLIKANLPPERQLGIVDPASFTPQWHANAAASDADEEVGHEDQRPPLDDIINLPDFLEAGARALTRQGWAYISTGSNDNITRDQNAEALRRIYLRPRVLVDVTDVDASTTLFGGRVRLSMPVLVAPTGASRTGGPDGELAIARGAQASGIVQVISTVAAYPYEEILRNTPDDGVAFFQLYVDAHRPRAAQLLRDLVGGPQGHKVGAVFVTVDLPVVSKREADERARLAARKEMLARNGHAPQAGGIARQSGAFVDTNFTWKDLSWLRAVLDGVTTPLGRPPLPIVVKGIQRADDARTALAIGCQGIVLSNHGGRAVDTAPPAIVTLLELHQQCPEIFGRMEVIVDGGFRRGSDVVKAVCLGASAVGIGRPFVCSVGYGADGVKHCAQILKDEIDTAMRLCGMTNLMRDANPEFVHTGDIDHLVPPAKHPYAIKPVWPAKL